MRTHRKDMRKGFSLIEALIVLAILAITATMGYGYMLAARPHTQLERGQAELSAELSGARNIAISREIAARVRFNPTAREFWTEVYDRASDSWSEETTHKILPDTVSFASGGISFPSNTINYTPRGTLMTGGTIIMESSTGETYTFTGNIATGKFPLEGGNLR
jgi:prepilin-type N-terminal cleavage/methylation domain-containing protein